MAEKTSEYSTFQWQRPFLTIDIKEWYLHRPIEPMEFCETIEHTPKNGSCKEDLNGRSKPLRWTITITCVPKRNGNERFITSVCCSDAKNSYKKAIEKELKKLVEWECSLQQGLASQ